MYSRQIAPTNLNARILGEVPTKTSDNLYISTRSRLGVDLKVLRSSPRIALKSRFKPWVRSEIVLSDWPEEGKYAPQLDLPYPPRRVYAVCGNSCKTVLLSVTSHLRLLSQPVTFLTSQTSTEHAINLTIQIQSVAPRDSGFASCCFMLYAFIDGRI